MIRRTVIVLLVTLLAGCAGRGAVYKMPIAEARRTLLATGLPPLVFGSESPAWEVHDEGADVVWIVRRDGGELFRYVAHLNEEGAEATRVSVELKGVKSGPGGDTEKSLAANPKIRDMYVVAVNERVASALEHRPFEISRVYPAMTAATLANMGKLNASADAAAAASEQEGRDNMAKAYADEVAGRR